MRLPTHRPPTHPGEMLLEEFLGPHEITQTELAEAIGVPFQRVNSLCKGRRSMTPDTALRLEKALGTSAAFWMGLQMKWDLWHALREGHQAFVEIRRMRVRRGKSRGLKKTTTTGVQPSPA